MAPRRSPSVCAPRSFARRYIQWGSAGQKGLRFINYRTARGQRGRGFNQKQNDVRFIKVNSKRDAWRLFYDEAAVKSFYFLSLVKEAWDRGVSKKIDGTGNLSRGRSSGWPHGAHQRMEMESERDTFAMRLLQTDVFGRLHFSRLGCLYSGTAAAALICYSNPALFCSFRCAPGSETMSRHWSRNKNSRRSLAA